MIYGCGAEDEGFVEVLRGGCTAEVETTVVENEAALECECWVVAE